MKIVKTTNCEPCAIGNRNYFRRRLFLADGRRIEIDLRMMSIPPFITDFKVWEYKTKTGRKKLICFSGQNQGTIKVDIGSLKLFYTSKA